MSDRDKIESRARVNTREEINIKTATFKSARDVIKFCNNSTLFSRLERWENKYKTIKNAPYVDCILFQVSKAKSTGRDQGWLYQMVGAEGIVLELKEYIKQSLFSIEHNEGRDVNLKIESYEEALEIVENNSRKEFYRDLREWYYTKWYDESEDQNWVHANKILFQAHEYTPDLEGFKKLLKHELKELTGENYE